MGAARPAAALGLGPGELGSALGQPLHLRIPVSGDAPDEVGCVQISGRDDLPTPSKLHSEVLSVPGRGTYIDITGLQPVNDPAISVVVSAGCSSPVKRDYILFLDPPPVQPALAQAAPTDQAPSLAAPVARPRAPRRLSPNPRGTVASGSADSAAGDGGAPAPSASSAPFAPAALPPPAAPPRSPAARARRHGRQEAAAIAPVAAPVAQDQLHLSRLTDDPELRVSEDLTLGDPDAPLDPERLKALRIEQARLLALLNGQNPDDVPSPHEQELQKQVQDLAGDIATLRQQVRDASARNKTLEASSFPSIYAWLLGAFAVLALLAAAYFARRYRSIQKYNAAHPWWEQTQMAPGADPLDDDGEPLPEPVMPEVLGVGQTTTERMAGSEVARVARATPRAYNPPAAPAPAPAADTAPLTVARPAVSGVAARTEATPAASARAALPSFRASAFGVASNPATSLDERIEPSDERRPVIDFNLDLPPVSQNTLPGLELSRGPAPQKRVVGAEASVNFAPLDFELPEEPAPQSPAPAESRVSDEDTILRLDDAKPVEPESIAEQASVQFKLIQFASVVEQVADAQRAGEPTRAIAMLRQYVLRDETIPTLMWLQLFELYRQINKRPVFEALAEHFQRRYKRTMMAWDETLDQKTTQQGLAAMPALEAQLKSLWGSQAGVELMRTLTCDRDQPDAIIFNALLQRDLLQLAKVFPLDDLH